MLFLPAAALCYLCSALVAMAEELIQDQLSQTRRVGEMVSISCGGTDGCDKKHVYWYQKTKTGPFTVILRIDLTDGKFNSRYNHPQQKDFSALRKEYGCDLMISSITLLHSATYYCICWKSVAHRKTPGRNTTLSFLVHNLVSTDSFSSRQVFVLVYFTVGGSSGSNRYLIFGSGTELYVTDKPVVKPVVSVYPAASRAHHEGKSSLLCVASNMFPPLVRFSWKRRKDNGPLEEQAPAEEVQLELRESGRTAAIRVIDGDALSTYKYRCYVQHEGGEVEAQTEQEVSALPQPAAPVQSWYTERQLCLMYTVLIVKSLVYCSGLSLLSIFRKGPSSDHTEETDSPPAASTSHRLLMPEEKVQSRSLKYRI
ncbi:immunoglobulin lambda-1 light chain-like [Micropterus dolomieu]|uniref:immunoglobulin lambda-1 light chain-like n=1 Tax=Micropterus dolomieu TaxID=147949 RepID=UPI001E8CCD88|nr:immunoglobulin lambda-1 light chain-like [Micropterus dolomieu]